MAIKCPCHGCTHIAPSKSGPRRLELRANSVRTVHTLFEQSILPSAPVGRSEDHPTIQSTFIAVAHRLTAAVKHRFISDSCTKALSNKLCLFTLFKQSLSSRHANTPAKQKSPHPVRSTL